MWRLRIRCVGQTWGRQRSYPAVCLDLEYTSLAVVPFIAVDVGSNNWNYSLYLDL